jgi:tetratricopeptide (TPR) repeat protein
MKEPETEEELQALHDLQRSDPQRYLQIVSGWIRQNPRNAGAYFRRHFGWLQLGEPQRALDDMNEAIALKPDAVSFHRRAIVHRKMGQHQKAIEDFTRAAATDSGQWHNDALDLLYQADSHARLGDEATALACCARLPDDFWTPGLNGAPSGNKAEIASQLRRAAAEARRMKP